MTGIKPLSFLSDKSEVGSFSIQDYIHGVDTGSSNWLFLAAEPSTRELTIPLNASLAELVIAYLMVHNTPKNRQKSNLSNKVKASAVDPAKPATILLPDRVLRFLAVAFTIWF